MKRRTEGWLGDKVRWGQVTFSLIYYNFNEVIFSQFVCSEIQRSFWPNFYFLSFFDFSDTYGPANELKLSTRYSLKTFWRRATSTLWTRKKIDKNAKEFSTTSGTRDFIARFKISFNCISLGIIKLKHCFLSLRLQELIILLKVKNFFELYFPYIRIIKLKHFVFVSTTSECKGFDVRLKFHVLIRKFNVSVVVSLWLQEL